MSIASEITRLQTAKSDLATSITNKGVTVPASATLDDYAALVDSIQTGGGSSLPYDAEIEYLQSDGAQYINTEVVLAKSYIIIIDCAVISAASTYPTVCGALNSSNYSCPLVYNTSGHPYVQVGGSSSYVYLYTSSYFSSAITHYVCRGDGSYQYLSNGLKTVNKSYSGSLSTLPMYLLARNYNGNAEYFAVAKIGRTSIRVGGVLQRDYIPVRVGQVGYMYDRVSKQLFGNDGTGSFTLGPDI